jgi:hypothetical protein
LEDTYLRTCVSFFFRLSPLRIPEVAIEIFSHCAIACVDF